jgi:hypothetical protein
MKIEKVTMTGADDSIKPEELFAISEKYPQVEWGLLTSRRSHGNYRFPSKVWLDRLFDLEYQKLNLSLHLCGDYVNEILLGDNRFINELDTKWSMFKRLQINTHGIKHKFSPALLRTTIINNPDKEFIFQYDEVNKHILESVKDLPNISALYDLSHGAGVVPKEWKAPIEGVKCGYAGGLSPQNIVNQLQLIEEKVGDATIWIDMETHLRSYDDRFFDLYKVVSVLEKCNVK